MDALSDVLRVAHLTGGVFLHAEFFAPWCIAARVAPEHAARQAPHPQDDRRQTAREREPGEAQPAPTPRRDGSAPGKGAVRRLGLSRRASRARITVRRVRRRVRAV